MSDPYVNILDIFKRTVHVWIVGFLLRLVDNGCEYKPLQGPLQVPE